MKEVYKRITFLQCTFGIRGQGFGCLGHFLLCNHEAIGRLAHLAAALLEMIREVLAHLVRNGVAVAYPAFHQTVPAFPLQMVGHDLGIVPNHLGALRVWALPHRVFFTEVEGKRVEVHGKLARGAPPVVDAALPVRKDAVATHRFPALARQGPKGALLLEMAIQGELFSFERAPERALVVFRIQAHVDPVFSETGRFLLQKSVAVHEGRAKQALARFATLLSSDVESEVAARARQTHAVILRTRGFARKARKMNGEDHVSLADRTAQGTLKRGVVVFGHDDILSNESILLKRKGSWSFFFLSKKKLIL